MTSLVTSTRPAARDVARAHFESLLSLETDCWDVHESMADGSADFVLLQTNGTSESFVRGHIDGAVHLHHSEIDESALAAYPPETVFVVYCAGPHCNAADRGAAKIAALGRPVKKMIGGITGWLDEGFELASAD